MAYGDFKDLARRTASDKILRDKAFHIAKNPKYDGYQRGLVSMVYKFFDKKSTGSDINNNNNNNNNNPETRKYWVDVQRGIVSSHGERGILFSLGWQSF